MLKLKTLVSLSRKHSDIADFIFIYIREAHASDEWFLPGNPTSISQHKTLGERIHAAKHLSGSGIPFPILVDSMSNDANARYAASPERLCVILGEKIVFLGGRGPLNFDLDKMEVWLDNYKLEMSQTQ